MKIQDAPDYFNTQSLVRNVARVDARNRRLLLRYAEKYAQLCEREDYQIPALRKRVNQ